MLRRLLIALLTLVLTAPALLAQPPQQNEYVPIDQLPPQETLPAAPLLIGAYIVVWLGLMGYLFWTIWRRIGTVETEMQALQRRTAGQRTVTAGHFIFIPAVLLVGVVIGWILGSRAARDAFAAELRRREERARKKRKRASAEADLS